MSLLDRIRRVLGEPAAAQSSPYWAAGLLALAVPLLGTVAGRTQAQSNSQPNSQSQTQAFVVAADEEFYLIEIVDGDSDGTEMRFPLKAGMSLRDALVAAKIEDYSLVHVERRNSTTNRQDLARIHTWKREEIEVGAEAGRVMQSGDRLRVVRDDASASISFEEAGELVSQYGSLLRQRKMKEAERFIVHLTSAQRTHPVVQVLVEYAATLEEREQGSSAQEMHLRTYNVARLVTPVVQRPTQDEDGTLPTTAAADYDALVDLVKQTIEPYSWDDAGGEASLRVYPSNLSLGIKQTQAGHDAVDELLKRLNEIQDQL